ncbi:MAG: efflux RND transporter periplasmic adaptor subunit [Thermodesulfobacteriota bacterium]|nr:efflux RND transporter periplasmic adaptor subunit [Thermodesulfobacteriota bacterium]
MQHKVSVSHLRLFIVGACTVYPVLIALLLMMSIFPKSSAAGPKGPGDGPPLVTVAAVNEQDVNPPAEYIGHVEAIQTVDLRARVEGFLEQVMFKEGSDVHAGDLLYVIEQAPYQARVDADKALVAQAEAVLTKARQYLKRARTVRSGGVSATDMDNAVTEELRALAGLEQAGANLARSELDLKYTMVKAPINGRIGRTAYTKGNLVGPTSGPLARIVQVDPIRVVYSISENNFADIRAALKDASGDRENPALASRIKLPDGEILKTAGQIDFVDNEIDAETGTIAVRAVFDNHDGLLLPGQYVTILICQSRAELRPIVPQSAVQIDRKGHYVLVVDSKNQVEQRRITTGAVINNQWAVESGLAVGEKVIVQGIQKVTPGRTVKTIIAGK